MYIYIYITYVYIYIYIGNVYIHINVHVYLSTDLLFISIPYIPIYLSFDSLDLVGCDTSKADFTLSICSQPLDRLNPWQVPYTLKTLQDGCCPGVIARLKVYQLVMPSTDRYGLRLATPKKYFTSCDPHHDISRCIFGHIFYIFGQFI